MRSIIQELCHGITRISKKSFTAEQKETFEKIHDCWSEYMSLAEAAIFEYSFWNKIQL